MLDAGGGDTRSEGAAEQADAAGDGASGVLPDTWSTPYGTSADGSSMFT